MLTPVNALVKLPKAKVPDELLLIPNVLNPVIVPPSAKLVRPVPLKPATNTLLAVPPVIVPEVCPDKVSV